VNVRRQNRQRQRGRVPFAVRSLEWRVAGRANPGEARGRAAGTMVHEGQRGTAWGWDFMCAKSESWREDGGCKRAVSGSGGGSVALPGDRRSQVAGGLGLGPGRQQLVHAVPVSRAKRLTAISAFREPIRVGLRDPDPSAPSSCAQNTECGARSALQAQLPDSTHVAMPRLPMLHPGCTDTMQRLH
jgi:hypothetical protein